MTTNNDQHYINKIIAGNTNAFSVLVERYKDLVFTLALRMLKNREEAEEVSQDTFVKVFKSLSKFKGDSKFSTWIYKVTYNTCLDRLKKQKRQFNLVAIDEFTEHQVKTIDNALEALEKQERNKAIQKCLHLLPAEDGFLLTLFYFEEQSLDEISKAVGVTPNNVKVKLYRSRKKMATILKKQLEPEIIGYYERDKDKHIEELIKKAMKETVLESPSIDFSSQVMSQVTAFETASSLKYKPLVSKKVWAIAAIGALALVLYVVLESDTQSMDWFSAIDWSIISQNRISKALSGITISKTFMYGIVFLGLMICIQIPFLKNNFDKQFEV